MNPEPFTIAIPDADIDDLCRRLSHTRLAPDFANEDWRFGVERGWLADILRYWGEEFDWRAQERAMNALPHYRVTIDGVPIHFVHVRSGRPGALPLILTHGWPWSCWDWHEMIAPLTDPPPGQPAFDLVIPSLPGFVFSEPLRTPGIDFRQVATLWTRLMRDVLGYERFGAAGADWGGLVTGALGAAHADHVSAIHLAIPILPGVHPALIQPSDYAPDEAWMAAQAAYGQSVVISHMTVHCTDPQTLAYGLTDSPAGTAAWILERRRAWTDCGGDVIGPYGRDFLCTNVALYWFTNTLSSSLRIYRETALQGSFEDSGTRIAVPTGFLIPPRDVVMLPRRLAAERTDLQRWTVAERGGHFLPKENPAALIAEYRAFFG